MKCSNLFHILFVLPLFTGCYCFREGTHQNVRYLSGNNYYPLCEWWGEGGHNLQINSYCAYPNEDLQQLKSFCDDNKAPSYHLSTSGLFGARVETYVSPFNIIPQSVLGLGIDCSFSKTELNYNSVNNTSYFNSTISRSKRVLLSANLMTFVSGYWIGYITMQGGINFKQETSDINDPISSRRNSAKTSITDFRFGTGLQYYFYSSLGVTAEIGYKGGSYLRMGLCYWIL